MSPKCTIQTAGLQNQSKQTYLPQYLKVLQRLNQVRHASTTPRRLPQAHAKLLKWTLPFRVNQAMLLQSLPQRLVEALRSEQADPRIPDPVVQALSKFHPLNSSSLSHQKPFQASYQIFRAVPTTKHTFTQQDYWHSTKEILTRACTTPGNLIASTQPSATFATRRSAKREKETTPGTSFSGVRFATCNGATSAFKTRNSPPTITATLTR